VAGLTLSVEGPPSSADADRHGGFAPPALFFVAMRRARLSAGSVLAFTPVYVGAVAGARTGAVVTGGAIALVEVERSADGSLGA
jgi:hypothetical protein